MDGFYGCYRGLSPKLVGSIVSVVGSKKVADKLGLSENDETEQKEDSEMTEEEWYFDAIIYGIQMQFLFTYNFYLQLWKISKKSKAWLSSPCIWYHYHTSISSDIDSNDGTIRWTWNHLQVLH